jgi:hypothetical protein
MTKRALQLIKKNEYIAMISFAGNVDSHIVALKVKRLRAVKWIAVSFDPLPNENYIFKNRALFNFKIRRIEKQLFIHADAMTFPHSLYYLYLKRAEYVTKKLYLLDFPLYKDIENNISRRKLGTNDSVELLYMGSLNKKVRDIEYLFELFSDFYDKPVTLSVIGDSVLQNRIDMAIKNYGYLPHEEAIGIARQENYIGINIGNNNHYSVPSKIFDYISLKLPIISIEVFRNVPTDYYLEKYGNYIKIWQGDSIIHNLEKVRLFINNVHTNINSMKTDEVFKENSPSYIAKRIDEIMSEI